MITLPEKFDQRLVDFIYESTEIDYEIFIDVMLERFEEGDVNVGYLHEPTEFCYEIEIDDSIEEEQMLLTLFHGMVRVEQMYNHSPDQQRKLSSHFEDEAYIREKELYRLWTSKTHPSKEM